MTARKILNLLHKDGWYVYDQDGSHLQLKHPSKPGKITVPVHSGKDIAPGKEPYMFPDRFAAIRAIMNTGMIGDVNCVTSVLRSLKFPS